MDQIKYRRLPRYKYELAENFVIHNIGIYGEIDEEYFSLHGDTLILRARYAWDGATWSIDTDTNRLPSLVHDVLRQMVREGLLPKSVRPKVDALYKKLCLDSGMHPLRAKFDHAMIRLHANLVPVRPYKARPVLTAPKKYTANKMRGG